jgi:tetratricopeptide (TPR) repeat protein
MNSNDLIEQLVVDASSDPLNPKKNFDIALEYERLGQTASAVGFYLRAAEYGYKTDPLVAYSSLLKISICIEGQKDRKNTVSNVILQAMAYLPERPEAYFLLSKFYEKDAGWQEAYTYAALGLNALKNPLVKLPVVVGEYHGDYSLQFQIAVSAWWIGRKEESLRLLNELDKRTDLSNIYETAVKANLNKLSV